ncbi:MAG: hypothetical protein MHM6MM_003051 [Cercozoa sp. M6MM]
MARIKRVSEDSALCVQASARYPNLWTIVREVLTFAQSREAQRIVLNVSERHRFFSVASDGNAFDAADLAQFGRFATGVVKLNDLPPDAVATASPRVTVLPNVDSPFALMSFVCCVRVDVTETRDFEGSARLIKVLRDGKVLSFHEITETKGNSDSQAHKLHTVIGVSDIFSRQAVRARMSSFRFADFVRITEDLAIVSDCRTAFLVRDLDAARGKRHKHGTGGAGQEKCIIKPAASARALLQSLRPQAHEALASRNMEILEAENAVRARDGCGKVVLKVQGRLSRTLFAHVGADVQFLFCNGLRVDNVSLHKVIDSMLRKFVRAHLDEFHGVFAQQLTASCLSTQIQKDMRPSAVCDAVRGLYLINVFSKPAYALAPTPSENNPLQFSLDEASLRRVLPLLENTVDAALQRLHRFFLQRSHFDENSSGSNSENMLDNVRIYSETDDNSADSSDDERTKTNAHARTYKPLSRRRPRKVPWQRVRSATVTLKAGRFTVRNPIEMQQKQKRPTTTQPFRRKKRRRINSACSQLRIDGVLASTREEKPRPRRTSDATMVDESASKTGAPFLMSESGATLQRLRESNAFDLDFSVFARFRTSRMTADELVEHAQHRTEERRKHRYAEPHASKWLEEQRVMHAPPLANDRVTRQSIADARAVGQCENQWLLAVSRGVLLVADQHAVHERIRYDKLQQMVLQHRAFQAQSLRNPIVLTNCDKTFLDCLENKTKSVIRDWGFRFRVELQQRRLLLLAFPDYVKKPTARFFVNLAIEAYQ